MSHAKAEEPATAITADRIDPTQRTVEDLTGCSLSRYGIMGLGAVCHTLNPRLFLADLEYIVNHAEDKILMLDLDLAGLIAKLRPKVPTVQHFIVLTDRQHMHKVVRMTLKASDPLHGHLGSRCILHERACCDLADPADVPECCTQFC